MTFGMISICLQQLLQAHGGVAGGLVPADPALALSAFWPGTGSPTTASLRLLLTVTVLPAVGLVLSASRCSPTPAPGCCIRPTWAAKARKWSTWSRKRRRPWDW